MPFQANSALLLSEIICDSANIDLRSRPHRGEQPSSTWGTQLAYWLINQLEQTNKNWIIVLAGFETVVLGFEAVKIARELYDLIDFLVAQVILYAQRLRIVLLNYPESRSQAFGDGTTVLNVGYVSSEEIAAYVRQLFAVRKLDPDDSLVQTIVAGVQQSDGDTTVDRFHRLQVAIATWMERAESLLPEF